MGFPRLSIAQLMQVVAGVAVVAGLLTQSFEGTASLFLTAAVVVVPAALLAMRQAAIRPRASARDLARTLDRVFRRHVIVTGYLLITGVILTVVVVVALIIVVPAVVPLDAVVTPMATATLLGLVVAGLLARYGRGGWREFGWGFSVFGWPALLVGLAPAVSERAPPLLSILTLDGLYHEWALGTGDEQPPSLPTLLPPQRDDTRRGNPPLWSPARWWFPKTPRTYLRFQRGGHYLLALLLATAGGLAARSLAARRVRAASESVATIRSVVEPPKCAEQARLP